MDYDEHKACVALETAVKLFCRKTQKRFKGTDEQRRRILKRVDVLVGHAQHIIQRLTLKRLSLHEAIESLKECWKSYHSALAGAKLKNLRSVLAVLLQHYLRIRDGLVLLESGECRHSGDYPKSGDAFKTRLTKNKTCGDGYTNLYSKNLKYSGFGWDEFYDQQHGVKTLLLNSLKSLSNKAHLDSIWESLLESGAQLFESCLDNHETKLQALRKSVEDLRDTVKQSLLQLLHKYAGGGGQVNFVTQDKMEYLEIRLRKDVAGISSVKLQRRANEFQVKDSQGVLPDGWNREKWKDSMSLPSRYIKSATVPIETDGTQKRRRVIDDSSSEDEAHDAVLHVQEKKVNDENVEHTVSLKAIKMNMGIDASGLESARETLEAENDESNAKLLSDDAREDEHLAFTIQNGRNKFARLQTVLHNAKEEGRDPIELWDIRDSLREEVMQLGNDLLLLHSQDGAVQHVKDARSFFKEAVQLVEQQESAHSLVSKFYNDDEGSLYRQRNLRLLKGRAQTNCGISALELSLAAKSSNAMRNKLRAEAAQELKSAIKCATTLYTKSLVHKSQGGSASETMQNISDATQLESLALRSLGTVLWHENNLSSAVESFEDAFSTYHKIELLLKDGGSRRKDVLELYMGTTVECYYACCTLYDLSAAKIDEKCVSSPNVGIDHNIKSFLQIAEKAITNAKLISTTVESLGLSPSEYGMEDVSKLTSVFDDLRNLVKNKSQTPNDCSQIASGPLSEENPRKISTGEMPIAVSERPRKISKARYLMSKSLQKEQSKFRASDRGWSNDAFVYDPFNCEDLRSEIALPCLKWGDEILRKPGEAHLVLEYPASAPSR